MSDNTITEKMVDDIINHSIIKVKTWFKKCTVVGCKLPNGFVIVESSACVDKKNYDEELGYEICMEKIKNKIWELEGYQLSNSLMAYKNIEKEESENVINSGENHYGTSIAEAIDIIKETSSEFFDD